MVNFDISELRSKIDTEKLFVDFGILRTALAVVKVVGDLDVSLSEPSREGECRGRCPKCRKEKSFSLNINTNRFNCFAKGCILKGGGVIDFCAKLYEVSAKEASHLVACAYGIQPYAQEVAASESPPVQKPVNNNMPAEKREVPAASLDPSEDIRQTAAYLISSIRHDLAQLEQLLISR